MFIPYINNLNQKKMQQSLSIISAPTTAPYYTLDGQYLTIPGFNYPFYFVNYSNLANYQMCFSNFVLKPFLYSQNTLQQNHLQFPAYTSSYNQTQLNSEIQNGKQSFQHIPDVLKKKACVKKQNSFTSEQKTKEDSQKRGNERFIKKNTQSNVINQIFSFLWTPQKSKQYLFKILESEQKVETFYNLMRTIKTYCKSELNRFYLKSLISSNEWQTGLKRLKKKVKKLGCIPSEQLCAIVRKLVCLYLRELSFLSIMTSKKMNHSLWNLHLQKCRQISNFLFEQSGQ